MAIRKMPDTGTLGPFAAATTLVIPPNVVTTDGLPQVIAKDISVGGVFTANDDARVVGNFHALSDALIDGNLHTVGQSQTDANAIVDGNLHIIGNSQIDGNETVDSLDVASRIQTTDIQAGAEYGGGFRSVSVTPKLLTNTDVDHINVLISPATLLLPVVPDSGKKYFIKDCTGLGAITVDGNGNTIDTTATVIVGAAGALHIMWNDGIGEWSIY